MPIIRSDILLELSRLTLRAAGATEEDASLVGESINKANLYGVDSHGIINLQWYVEMLEEGKIKSGSPIKIVRESVVTALIDGNDNFGQVSCRRAVEIAVDKAEKNMIGIVGIIRCNHIGMLRWWSEMIVDRGMIGIVYVSTDPCVAPHGGMKPMIGTNPLSYGFPVGKERPIIIDFATATSAEGKIRDYLQRGERVPEGWILDKKGYPTTNPADFYEQPLPPIQIKIGGAQLPMAGHKGFGLAIAVDILGGALTGTGCDGEVLVGEYGTLVQAINIEAFCPIEEYKNRVDKLIRDLKSSPVRPGMKEILMPGEPELRIQEERLRSGIPVPENTWNATLGLARKYGVDVDGILHK